MLVGSKVGFMPYMGHIIRREKRRRRRWHVSIWPLYHAHVRTSLCCFIWKLCTCADISQYSLCFIWNPILCSFVINFAMYVMPSSSRIYVVPSCYLVFIIIQLILWLFGGLYHNHVECLPSWTSRGCIVPTYVVAGQVNAKKKASV